MVVDGVCHRVELNFISTKVGNGLENRTKDAHNHIQEKGGGRCHILSILGEDV
jgi:hypothetical protein